MEHLNEEQVNQIQALNKLMIDYGKSQARIILHLRNTIFALIICFTLIICALVYGFFWFESQYETTEESITTTTMTTEGDNANINSVTNGDQYNDSSVHNE